MPVGTSERATAVRVGMSVFLNYLFSNLGYYTLLPILPLLLTKTPGATPWFVGSALFTLTFCIRASCLLMSSLLHRSSIRVTISAGLALAAVGFGALGLARSPAEDLACLAVAGTGVSVNTLMARTYVAIALHAAGARNTAYSVIQVSVNMAAAVGPIAANLLFSNGLQKVCLLVVASLYAIAAGAVAAVLPAGVRPSDDDPRPAKTRRAIRAVVSNQQVRRITVIAIAGWFLYGQLFSALTLHIDATTASPLARSSFFITNAVLVALVQVPVSAYAARKLGKDGTPVQFLVIGLGVFAAAFGWMAGAGGSLQAALGGIAIFSVAETFFTPFVATAFAETSANRPVIEAFALLQIVTAIGEPLGSFSGGALFPTLTKAGLGAAYWAGLSALTIALVVVYWRSLRQRIPSAQPIKVAGTEPQPDQRQSG